MFRVNIKRLNPFLGRSERDFIGIDFNGNNLRLVHTKVIANKMEIVNLLSRNIGGLSDEDISKTIRSAFSELNIKTPEIVNIIPSHLIITKNIEIPSIDPREIKEIINLQAGRHTPYSREEIIVDYIDIGIYKHNYTKILLVILARNVAKRQLEILDRAGLKIERVSLAAEGVACFISPMLELETQAFPANIIHIDESFTDFIMVFRKKAIFIRSIPIGAQHLMEEKERYQMKFADEIRKSLEAYYIEEVERTPNVVILTGAIQELTGLENILNDALRLPLKVMPYFKNLSMREGAGKAASLTKRLSFLNVIASLITQQELKVNLIPEEVKLRKSFEERGKDLIKTGIFVLTIFVLVFSVLISKIHFKSAYLKKLNEKYLSLNKQVEEFESDFSRLGIIKNYLLKRGFPLEVLTELYNILPLEIELNDIKFDEQGRFSIKGTSESMSLVFSFVDGMGKSKYFKNVKTKYTTKRKVGLKDFTDFEITCQLNI